MSNAARDRAAHRWSVGRAVGSAIVIGVLGGLAFDTMRLPLAWMLGPMVAVTLAVTLGARTAMPKSAMTVCYGVLGVLLGGAFTPEVFSRAAQWATTTAVLLVYILVIAFTVVVFFRRVIGYDPVTAYFAAMPGGLAEMTIIGSEMGGDGRTIALIHGTRVLVVALVIPLGFRFIAGYEPQGVQALGGGMLSISWADAAILAGCAVAGNLLGGKLRLPAPFLTGPLIASAIAHMTGLVDDKLPVLVIAAAQLGIGVALGSQFVGVPRKVFLRTLGVAVSTVAVMLAITLGFSFGLASATDWPADALLLAFAPGGITEMTIIALAMGIDVVFVASHHMVRIVFVIMAAPVSARLMGGGRRESGEG